MKKFWWLLVLAAFVGGVLIGRYPLDNINFFGDNNAKRIQKLETQITSLQYGLVDAIDAVMRLSKENDVLKKQPPVIKEVEKIVYRDRFIEPREFLDLETLQAWYDKNHFTFVAVPGADCDDSARVLQLLAFRDGWLLDKQLVRASYLWDVYLGVGNHMGLIAIIGNDIYYVEPGPKPLIKFITKKD